MKQRHRSIQLLKVGVPGSPDLRQRTLRQLARCNLRRNEDVVILDFLKEDELALAYQAANLFACPSLYEGFCLPLLEAMASGTPVVCVAGGAEKEVAGAAAWLASSELNDFCAATENALSNADSARKVAVGLARAHSLTWERTGTAFLAALQAVPKQCCRGNS